MAEFVRDGTRIHYVDTGEGVPVLFHTGGGGDWQMWQLAGYTDALAGCRHLLMDHRGHGRSDKPEGIAAHRMDEYVSDVIGLLDDSGVDSAVMIGYSGGASVLFRVAAAHPERCTALVAIGQVPTDEAHDPAPGRAFAADVRADGMRAAMEAVSAGEAEPAPGWLVENLSTTETEMFALLLEAWTDAGRAWDELPRIEAPTLLVCGEVERAPEEASRAAQRMPDGRAVVLPGYGHLQAFWHAEVTAPLIVEFLDAHGLLRGRRALRGDG